MKLSLKLKFIISLLLLSPTVMADDAPKLQLNPSGRILIDGALFASPQKELFRDGMAIPEARLGVKMAYGNWSSWIDVGFAYGKIGLRNMWIQYQFDKNNIVRAGSFLQPFGLQGVRTFTNKSTFEQPLASAIFTPGIQLGAMYIRNTKSFYGAASFHVESAALNNIMNYPQFNQQGYSIVTRLVWRQKDSTVEGNPIYQVGISGCFSTPQRNIVDNEDIHDGFSMSANFPTRVTNITAIGVTVGNAMNLFKFTPELLLAYKKVALQSQYFFQRINRRQNMTGFNSQSGYITLRGILKGGDYKYEPVHAELLHPTDKSLELALDYNYATLSDSHAGIYGGRANSFNATLNYYFNPYFTARLNYTYTHTWGRKGYDPTTLNGFQMRLMVLF